MSIYHFKRFRMSFGLEQELWDCSLPGDFHFVPWHPDLLALHAKAKHQSFQNEVDANVFVCFATLPSCQRLMTEIAQRDGFLPQATWMVVRGLDPHTARMVEEDGEELRSATLKNLLRSNQVCGTIQGLQLDLLVGSVQNLGVVPKYRGSGIGAALLRRAVEGFRACGLAKATLEVTADNYGAVRLYQRLGWQIEATVYKSVEIVARNVAD